MSKSNSISTFQQSAADETIIDKILRLVGPEFGLEAEDLRYISSSRLSDLFEALKRQQHKIVETIVLQAQHRRLIIDELCPGG